AEVRSEHVADHDVRLDRAGGERSEQGRATGARGVAAEALVVNAENSPGGVMQATKYRLMSAAALLAVALGSAQAQDRNAATAVTPVDQARLPVPAVEPPPKPFKTAEE